MPGTETTRIAAVGAFFLLVLLIFIGFGPAFLGVWPEMLMSAVSCAVAIHIVRTARGPERTFFLILAIALVFDVVNLATLRMDISVSNAAWDAAVGKNAIPLSYLFWGLFLFLWSCAWGLKALRLIRKQRSTSVFVVSGVVLAALASLYALQYLDYGMNVLDADERFSTLFLALELIGLLLGLLCVLMGVGRHSLFMIVGFAMFAATDIVVIDLRLHDLSAQSLTLNPLWTLGRALILAGMLTQPCFRSKAERVRRGDTFLGAAGTHSALSGVLLIFSLGAVFVAAIATGLLWDKPHWLAMFFVLFCVACVVALSIITARFDHTVAYTRTWMQRLFGSKLEFDGWPDTPKHIRGMLEITELDTTLDAARAAADAMQDEVLFLGPERLNRPQGSRSGPRALTCFVMMPFGAAWSDAVHESIRRSCKRGHVRPLRGDDIFTPTDILDDIWRGIVECDFVIADITGRNTNVFYELGMAHALGKPVLILSQSEDDVPIDLKTRRILMYAAADLPALEAGLDKCIEEVLEKYELGPRARRSAPDSDAEPSPE